jgi:hypothetical protein
MKIPDFTKLIKFDSKFFEKLGKKTVVWHKMNIQIDGINARTGNPFVKYTPDYKRRKAKGKAVKQGKSQRSRKISPPNLTLTGAMMDSFKFIQSSDEGYRYGIIDEENAAKMIGNQTGHYGGNTNLRKKRIVSDKENPLPPKVKTKVTTAIAGRIAENFRDVFTKKGYVVNIIKM